MDLDRYSAQRQILVDASNAVAEGNAEPHRIAAAAISVYAVAGTEIKDETAAWADLQGIAKNLIEGALGALEETSIKTAAGSAVITKPSFRYDTAALEALRLSSDANDRLLSPFRKETPGHLMIRA